MRRLMLFLATIMLPAARQLPAQARAELPTPAAVFTALKTSIDSSRLRHITNIWPAAGGGLWVIGSTEFSWVRRIRAFGPDGKPLGQALTEGNMTSEEPWWVLPTGELVLRATTSGRSNGMYLTCVAPDGSRPGRAYIRPTHFSRYTSVLDSVGIIHVFGTAWNGPAMCSRYGLMNDSMVELGTTPFEAPPMRYPTIIDGTFAWDGPGRVVATRVYGPDRDSVTLYRFDLPNMELVDTVSFITRDAAAFMVRDRNIGHPRFVSAKDGRWLYIASLTATRDPTGQVVCTYSVLLDTSLRPMRSRTLSEATLLPREEAPPGSETDISVTHGISGTAGPVIADIAERHDFSATYLTFGSDGHLYESTYHDSLVYRVDTWFTSKDPDVIHGGGDSLYPDRVTFPRYPELARMARIGGQTTVAVFLSGEGTVDSVAVARNSGNQTLDVAALDAARDLTFTGRALNGSRTIACEATYLFDLDRRRPCGGRLVELRLRTND